jgi:hypothetical protein
MSLSDRGRLEQERFARPVTWLIAIGIVVLATLLLFEARG